MGTIIRVMTSTIIVKLKFFPANIVSQFSCKYVFLLINDENRRPEQTHPTVAGRRSTGGCRENKTSRLNPVEHVQL